MVLIFEMLFVLILSMILFMLYRNERIITRSMLPRADVEEFWDGMERRRHARLRRKLIVYYRIITRPHIKNRCRTVDISEGGMKLLLNEKLDKGVMLEIKISIPKSGKNVEVEGDVAWAEEISERDAFGRRLFYAGIKFSAINDPDGSSLVEYIRSLTEKGQESA